jgi:hypothetical protein
MGSTTSWVQLNSSYHAGGGGREFCCEGLEVLAAGAKGFESSAFWPALAAGKPGEANGLSATASLGGIEPAHSAATSSTSESKVEWATKWQWPSYPSPANSPPADSDALGMYAELLGGAAPAPAGPGKPEVAAMD